MKTFLNKDSFGNWNTIHTVPVNKLGNVNCHKFVLYTIGKISWKEMVSEKEIEDDFTFSEMARNISDVPFTFVENLPSLLSLANNSCEIEKVYVGQILDTQTNKMAHSFIIQRESDGKYTCFDKPGFKYPFGIHSLKKILNFVNKDGEKSNQNQKWRFIPANNF